MSKHWHSIHTQAYWTCMSPTQGRTINYMDEFGEVKGWRLGAIIHTLYHQYQWPIETEFKGPERIAHSSLFKESTDWRARKLPPSAKAVREALNYTGGSADE